MSFLLRMTREASAEGTCQLIESSGTGQELLDATGIGFGASSAFRGASCRCPAFPSAPSGLSR